MSTEKLMKSTKYEDFQQDPDNRAINEYHVKQLYKNMQVNGFLPAYPLHVTNGQGDKKFIRDGGHRFEAAKRLKIPFYYVVCDALDLSIPDINKTQKGWTIHDYADAYARQGIADYIELLEFRENYKLSLGLCARLLMGKEVGKLPHTHKVKDGTFRIANRKYALMVVGIIMALRPISKLLLNSQFQNAISQCCFVPEFDTSRFVRNAQRVPGFLVPQATNDDYLNLCETIYNHHMGEAKRFPLAFHAKQTSSGHKTKKNGEDS
jgi:hypothetical protein